MLTHLESLRSVFIRQGMPQPERLATLNGIAITRMRTHVFTLPISLFTLSQSEIEFEKFRIVQDRLFLSDFDQMINKLPEKGDTP